ncbi:MAG: ABC transporter substrate-binding protein [Burkholderiaceae bacterium]
MRVCLARESTGRADAIPAQYSSRARGRLLGARTARGCLGLSLALTALACSAQELTIAVANSVLSLPIFVAQAQKYFADEGVPVKTVECVGGPRCLGLILEDQAALVTVSDMTVMFNSFGRTDYAIVATIARSTSNLKLITRKSAGIASVAQLAGKRVGTVKATGAHYFLDSSLLFDGIDPKRIELVLLSPEQIGAALEQGRIDAASIWEPHARRSLRELAGDGAVIPSPRSYSVSFNLVANRRIIAERQTDLVKVLRALARAQRFIREQPQQAQAILVQTLRQDQDDINALWNDLDYRLAIDQLLLNTLQAQARWALREGHVPHDARIPNYLRFVATEPLRQAVPMAVTLDK